MSFAEFLATDHFVPLGLQGLGVPHLDQYFGAWAVHEGRFRSLVDHVNSINLQVHVQEAKAAGPISEGNVSPRLYQMLSGGIAVIDLRGPLMKFSSSLSNNTSTVFARRQVRMAAADEEVKAILLRIDSPGGTVSGTQDLGDEIAAAAKMKPTEAYVEDMAASAAFWLASQARRINANATALVGSIGTYATVTDSSGEAAMNGYKVHVVKAGDMKGAGVPGTEVTAQQLAEVQRIVNDLNGHFLAAVAAGRKMSIDQVTKLADGRVHIAADAKSLGLIDAVESFDQTVARLRSAVQPSSKTMIRSQTMSEPAAPVAATLDEITAACPGADEKFLLAQLRAKATVPQAASAWMAELNTRLKASTDENAALKAAVPAKPATKTGVPVVTSKTPSVDADADPVAEWNAVVADKLKLTNGDRAKAIRLAVHENKALHAAYLAAINQRRQVA